MKNIIQELNEYNVPIIKIDESLAKVKYDNRFSQKLADANAFLARAGVPNPSNDYAAMREQDERSKLIHTEKKGKLEVAKKLKERGMSNGDIRNATGLSDEEIENL